MGSGETSYFTPLLFTKRRDAQEQASTSYTTPRPSRSPKSPSSAGHTSGVGVQRRRSTTPTSSTALQPAEPPLRSLYSDNFGESGNKENNLPLALPPTSSPDRDIPFQALTLDAGKDNVVTIFGFPNTEKSQAIILQEFGKCGDIVRFHRHTQCNWMHIQYANKYEAQRALLKNGLILSASIMIGVQPLAQQHLHLFDVDSERDTILQIPKVSDKQQQLTEKDVLIPVPPKRGWSKVTELVFGV